MDWIWMDLFVYPRTVEVGQMPWVYLSGLAILPVIPQQLRTKKKKNPTVLNSIARYTLVNHSPFNAVQKTAMRCSEVRTNLAFAEARLLRRLGNVTALQCLKWFQRRTRYAAFF